MLKSGREHRAGVLALTALAAVTAPFGCRPPKEHETKPVPLSIARVAVHPEFYTDANYVSDNNVEDPRRTIQMTGFLRYQGTMAANTTKEARVDEVGNIEVYRLYEEPKESSASVVVFFARPNKSTPGEFPSEPIAPLDRKFRTDEVTVCGDLHLSSRLRPFFRTYFRSDGDNLFLATKPKYVENAAKQTGGEHATSR